MAELFVTGISAELQGPAPHAPKARFAIGPRVQTTRPLGGTLSPRWEDDLVFRGDTLPEEVLEVVVEDSTAPGSNNTFGSALLQLAEVPAGSSRRSLTLTARGQSIGVIAFTLIAEGALWVRGSRRLLARPQGDLASRSTVSYGTGPEAAALRQRLQDLEGTVGKLQTETERHALRAGRAQEEADQLARANEKLGRDNDLLLKLCQEKKTNTVLLKDRCEVEVADLGQEMADLRAELATLREREAAVRRSLDREAGLHAQAQALVLDQQRELEALRRVPPAPSATPTAAACRALQRVLTDLGVDRDLTACSLQELCDLARVEGIRMRNKAAGVGDRGDFDLRRRVEGVLRTEFACRSDPSGYAAPALAELLAAKARGQSQLVEEYRDFTAKLSRLVGLGSEYGASTTTVTSNLEARLACLLEAVRERLPEPSALPALPGRPPEYALVTYEPPPATMYPREASLPPIPLPPSAHDGAMAMCRSEGVPSRNAPWHSTFKAEPHTICADDELGRQILLSLSELQRADVKAKRLTQKMGAQEGRLHTEAAAVAREVGCARDQLDRLAEQLTAGPILRRTTSREGSRSSTPACVSIERRRSEPVLMSASGYGTHVFFRRGREVDRPSRSQSRSRSRSRSRSAAREPSPGRVIWR